MGDAGDGVAFVEADLGKKGSGGDKKNPFPFSGKKLWQDIAAQNRGCTAAATSAGVGVLLLGVVDQDSTVLVAGTDIIPFLIQQIYQDFLPYCSQVTGKNGVIVCRCPVKIQKILMDRVTGSRSHTATHVHGIFQSVIHQSAGCQAGNGDTAVSAAERTGFS